MRKRIAITIIALLIIRLLNAQCSNPIIIDKNSAYFENFDSGNGNWFVTANSNASDWSWGVPVKTTINNTVNNNHCWISGGLSKNNYNKNENAFVQSPCFDLSGLSNPMIRLKLFWESEHLFDGANLQYSTDKGNTWKIVGTNNEANNCFNKNWYNSIVRFLLFPETGSQRAYGWSGSINRGKDGSNCLSGNGSGGWVDAEITMPYSKYPDLKNAKHVLFRMNFAAGSTCNGYDGFAFDDFYIGETPANKGSISFTCIDDKTLSFVATTDYCPSIEWNFGDPASGTNNISTLKNPQHTFSSSGDFVVTITLTGPDNETYRESKTITILKLDLFAKDPSCFGNSNGIIKATVIPAGNYEYFWNGNPNPQSFEQSNLTAGTYSIQVKGSSNSCPATQSVILNNPPVVNVPQVQIKQPTCTEKTGTIIITAPLGTEYSYSIGADFQNAPLFENINNGSYSVVAKNKLIDCLSEFKIVNIENPPLTFTVKGVVKQVLNCQQQKGIIEITEPVGPEYEYSINGSFQKNPLFSNLQAGTYNIAVKNINTKCTNNTAPLILTEPTCNTNQIFIPNAFSPNGDSRNDYFQVLGNNLREVKLLVFNQWGEKVFESNSINQKWDGTYKGKEQPIGVYVYTVLIVYTNGLSENRKGSITLIR
jgi:gliding motility-associated-like protein